MNAVDTAIISIILLHVPSASKEFLSILLLKHTAIITCYLYITIHFQIVRSHLI